MRIPRCYAVLIPLASVARADALLAQSGSVPLRLGDYLLPRHAETTPAASAAPPSVTREATMKVLTERGYTVLAPYSDNATPGGNAFGGTLLFVTDDPGPPFTVVVIPVDHALAIEAGAINVGGTR